MIFNGKERYFKENPDYTGFNNIFLTGKYFYHGFKFFFSISSYFFLNSDVPFFSMKIVTSAKY